jgi:hypothetical protein
MNVVEPAGQEWSRLSKVEIRQFGLRVTRERLETRGFVVDSDPDARSNVAFVRHGDRSAELHVQTRRDLRYPFWGKSSFRPRDGLYACLVRLPEGSEVEIFIIPSRAWLRPDGVLVSRDYAGKFSQPEWGINLSQRTLPVLDRFLLERSDLVAG